MLVKKRCHNNVVTTIVVLNWIKADSDKVNAAKKVWSEDEKSLRTILQKLAQHLKADGLMSSEDEAKYFDSGKVKEYILLNNS